MAVSHVFSNTVADWTGTVTVHNSQGSTTTIAATNIVRPGNWNSVHNQFFTLTGNTSGSSTASGTNIILSGGTNITLQGSSDSIRIIGADGPPTLSFFDNMGVGATSLTQFGDATLYVFPFTPINEVMPGNMTVSSVFLNVTQSVSTAATWTNRVSIGFYSSVNSTQLTLVHSGSTTWGTNAGAANVNQTFGGTRWLTIDSSNFNTTLSFAANRRYWCAIWHRTSNNAGSMSFNFVCGNTLANSGARSGIMGLASTANSTLGWNRFCGIYSVSVTTAMPNALAASDINKSVAQVQFFPQVILNNVGTNIV